VPKLRSHPEEATKPFDTLQAQGSVASCWPSESTSPVCVHIVSLVPEQYLLPAGIITNTLT
jgi:hypothetical protein